MKNTLRRTAALTCMVAATLVTTALPASIAPANAAAPILTNYGFSGLAFGTYVTADQAGLRSGRTALSFIGCTRRADRTVARQVAAADAPPGGSALAIGAVTSVSQTYKLTNGQVGERGTATVAHVRLGPKDGPHLIIKGLEVNTDAFARKDGSLGAASSFNSADIIANTGVKELDDLLSQVTNPLKELRELIEANGGAYEIPGLGVLHLGNSYRRVGATSAGANAIALQVHLYGPNGAAKGGDDVRVVVGRSKSRIERHVTSGVFRGFGHGLSATLLEGDVLKVGPLGEKRLNCQGTWGKVLTDSVAGLNLGNAGVVQVGAISGTVFGQQYKDGTAKAWTRGSVAGISLGSGDSRLVIKGIIGRANVTKYKSGAVRTGIAGSQIASITIGGEEHEIPDPGQTIEIPGLAKVQFFAVQRPNKRSITVSAVKITLLDETPGVSVILLGTAKAAIKAY